MQCVKEGRRPLGVSAGQPSHEDRAGGKGLNQCIQETGIPNVG